MASRRSYGLALLPALADALGTTARMDAVLDHLLLESQQLAVQNLPKEGLEEMDNVVLRLEECLAKLQDIQSHLMRQAASPAALANVTNVDIPQPINDMASRVSREIQPFIVVGLVCVTVALLKGRRPLDLFSVDIYSPWEAALAFTLSSFTGLVLVNQWVMSFLPDNPFTLYFSELAMCFLAVTTCAPLLMGASKFSTRWQASASLIAVICFGALCLADEISRVVFFFVVKESRSSSENYSLVLVPCLVVVTLYVGLLLTSLLKVLYRWGLTWRCVEPYGVGLLRNCKTYVAARLAGRAAGELPVPLPAAVLVQVAGVGSFMAMLVLQMGYLGYVRYHELRLLAVALLRPIEPLFKLAGAPLPTDALDFAMPRIIISYYLALGCGACYEIWLMFTVYEVPADPEEKRIRAVVDKAKKMNKDPSLIPGPVVKPDAGRPAPPLAKMPIFGAQQLMLDNGVPSQVGVPVFGKPVMIQMLPPLALAMELVAHGAAFERGRWRQTRTRDFL